MGQFHYKYIFFLSSVLPFAHWKFSSFFKGRFTYLGQKCVYLFLQNKSYFKWIFTLQGKENIKTSEVKTFYFIIRSSLYILQKWLILFKAFSENVINSTQYSFQLFYMSVYVERGLMDFQLLLIIGMNFVENSLNFRITFDDKFYNTKITNPWVWEFYTTFNTFISYLKF